MKILSITTSSNICSVSIFFNEEKIDELTINNEKTHSENLMPLINNILLKNNIKISDFDLLACDIGPGSFTGIRIGIASIKAIAFALNIKIIPVTSLQALSYNEENYNYYCTLINAKNNNAYCGLFNNQHKLINNYSADTIENILNTLPLNEKIIFIGDGSIEYKNIIKEKLGTYALFSNNNILSAESISKCALHNTNQINVDELMPLYLRPSQAERLQKHE